MVTGTYLSFFHAFTNQRQGRNNIQKIETSSGGVMVSHIAVERDFVD